MKKRKNKLQQLKASIKAEAQEGSGFVPGESIVLNTAPCFTDDEISTLIDLVEEDNSQGKLVHTTAVATNEIRRSKVRWLTADEHGWVHKKIWEIAVAANQKYRFDITGIREKIQLSIYDESEEGFYRWHMDTATHSMVRKISISIPLNNPDEYEGGDLEFNVNGHGQAAPQPKGSVILFPSFIMHRVTPVTKGRRYSLVCWISGPPLK